MTRQSIDNSLLSYHNQFQPDWSKHAWSIAKKRMPIYGKIGIFRAISAHSLPAWPNINIFSWYQVYSTSITIHQITSFSAIFSLRFLKLDLRSKKSLKNYKICQILKMMFLKNLGYGCMDNLNSFWAISVIFSRRL